MVYVLDLRKKYNEKNEPGYSLLHIVIKMMVFFCFFYLFPIPFCVFLGILFNNFVFLQSLCVCRMSVDFVSCGFKMLKDSVIV